MFFMEKAYVESCGKSGQSMENYLNFLKSLGRYIPMERFIFVNYGSAIFVIGCI